MRNRAQAVPQAPKPRAPGPCTTPCRKGTVFHRNRMVNISGAAPSLSRSIEEWRNSPNNSRCGLFSQTHMATGQLHLATNTSPTGGNHTSTTSHPALSQNSDYLIAAPPSTERWKIHSLSVKKNCSENKYSLRRTQFHIHQTSAA